MKLSVKKGDNVLVIAGKDAGKTGEILEVNREAGKVVVAGVNTRICKKCGASLEVAKKAVKNSKKA